MHLSAPVLCLVLPGGLLASPPVWVLDEAALPRLFPAATFVTGRGLSGPGGSEADRLREAQDRARQELASALRVRVRSEFTSQTTTTQTTSQGRTTAEGRKMVQNLVQTQADLDLEGLDRVETWSDPRTGTVHALAVLDRAKAGELLAARLGEQAKEARQAFQRASGRDLEGLLRTRSLLKRLAEGQALLRVLGGQLPPTDLPTFADVDQAARALLASRSGLDAGLDTALYGLGADLPGGLRVMVDRIVYGQTRFSSTFGAYLEQRLGDRLLKFDGIRLLDRALAARQEGGPKAQALVHGTYLEMGPEVSLLLKVTSLEGEELASSQVRLPRAAIEGAGLRLLPENHTQAAQSLAILNTDVPASDLQVNVQLDRGDGGIYHRGEPLHLFLKANRDCYVRVVYQQVDGTRVQILPNQFQRTGRLDAGVATRIPGEGSGFELRVSEPFGSEIVQVFASTEPFDLGEAAPEGPFTRLDASLQTMTRQFRGIRVEKARALTAEATAVVNTVDLPRR